MCGDALQGDTSGQDFFLGALFCVSKPTCALILETVARLNREEGVHGAFALGRFLKSEDRGQRRFSAWGGMNEGLGS